MLKLNETQEIQPVTVIEMKDPLKIKMFRVKLNKFKLNDPKRVDLEFDEFDDLTKKDINALIKADSDFKNTTKICKIKKEKNTYELSVYIMPTEGIESIKHAGAFNVDDEVVFKKDWVYKPKKPIKKEKNEEIFNINGHTARVNKLYKHSFLEAYPDAHPVDIPKNALEINLKDIKVGDKLTVFCNGKITNFIQVNSEDEKHLYGTYLMGEQKNNVKLSKRTIYIKGNIPVRSTKEIKTLRDFIAFTKRECVNHAVAVKTRKSHKTLYKKQQLAELLSAQTLSQEKLEKKSMKTLIAIQEALDNQHKRSGIKYGK